MANNFLNDVLRRTKNQLTWEASSAISGVVRDAILRPTRDEITEDLSQSFHNATHQWKCDCGTTNTSNFCANCGKAKLETKGQFKCPSCGTVLNDGVSFCTNCGHKVKE